MHFNHFSMLGNSADLIGPDFRSHLHTQMQKMWGNWHPWKTIKIRPAHPTFLEPLTLCNKSPSWTLRQQKVWWNPELSKWDHIELRTQYLSCAAELCGNKSAEHTWDPPKWNRLELRTPNFSVGPCIILKFRPPCSGNFAAKRVLRTHGAINMRPSRITNPIFELDPVKILRCRLLCNRTLRKRKCCALMGPIKWDQLDPRFEQDPSKSWNLGTVCWDFADVRNLWAPMGPDQNGTVLNYAPTFRVGTLWNDEI